MPLWMPTLWWSYGFFWGGWYQSIKDPMHYEFLGTRDDARGKHRAGQAGARQGRAQALPLVRGGVRRGSRSAQEQLALLGFDPGEIDGVYGPDTRAARVEAFLRDWDFETYLATYRSDEVLDVPELVDGSA